MKSSLSKNMRVLLLFMFMSVIVLIWIQNAYAEDFSPSTMHIKGENVAYDAYDGACLIIPVRVSGAPANVILSVFTMTSDQKPNHLTNGYLGWHYVNNIDTCMYISPPNYCSIGENFISWDIKDSFDHEIRGDFTYYLWGYDNVTEMQCVARNISSFKNTIRI